MTIRTINKVVFGVVCAVFFAWVSSLWPLRRARWGLALLVALALSACDGSSSDTATLVDDGRGSGSGTLSLSVPTDLMVRAVDTENLVPRVLINGVAADTVQTEGQWESRVIVPRGSDVSIEIIWIERFAFRELRLATVEASVIAVNSDRVIQIFTNDYDTDSEDIDRDGISNLAERIGDSDPFDDSDPGSDFAQVDVPFIDPAGAPVIDGIEDLVWGSATIRDRSGELLEIDNLMIDQGATRLDGDTEFAWKAMHDGNNLYLLIYGEGANGQSPFGDSTPDDWNDDAIDIFWDPDNSKLSDYDGSDDSHLLLPLLRLNGEANRSGQPGTRFFNGFNSVSLDQSSIEFVACPCPGSRAVWEVRMGLAENLMEVDSVIGFEVQIADDNDGGDRDAKWGWFHPSRSDTDVDNTWQNPTFMSTIRLVPSLF